MKISAALPAGVAGLLFDEAKRRRALESRLVEHLEAAGFSEVILPILDYFEPYEPLLTSSSREELYRFVDRDGELLVLRGDFTPMLARLLAPQLASLSQPLRVFYRGDVVRFQEARPGRQREYYELGAELVGLAGENADREVLHLFIELLVAEGPGPVQVVLGFAGALDRLLQSVADPSARGELAAAVARRERALARQVHPVLLQVVEAGVPEDPGELGPEGAAHLESVLALGKDLEEEFRGRGVHVVVDLGEFATDTLDGEIRVPGSRPYYDGLVFRAHLPGAALPIGGGGRYDRLFHRLGAEAPAVGFSIGLDRLLQARAGGGQGGGGG